MDQQCVVAAGHVNELTHPVAGRCRSAWKGTGG